MKKPALPAANACNGKSAGRVEYMLPYPQALSLDR